MVCFALSAYLMVELNNAYALLRVRSRMVSSVFMALTCTMTFLFHSMTGGLVQLFTIASLLLLLSTPFDSFFLHDAKGSAMDTTRIQAAILVKQFFITVLLFIP